LPVTHSLTLSTWCQTKFACFFWIDHSQVIWTPIFSSWYQRTFSLAYQTSWGWAQNQVDPIRTFRSSYQKSLRKDLRNFDSMNQSCSQIWWEEILEDCPSSALFHSTCESSRQALSPIYRRCSLGK
jgi:hypothetical protein